jgi:hypothetical protein
VNTVNHKYMDLLKPQPLRRGDAIGVVAPAGRVKSRRIDRALERLRARGFKTAVLFLTAKDATENKVEALVFRDVSSKLAELLVKLASEYGVDDARGTLEERVRTNRRMLPELTHAVGEWQREFSAVVDSIAPFNALVAQASGALWGVRASCVAVVHMRVYVGNFTAEWVSSRAAIVGPRVAHRFFRPVKRTPIDTAGWRGIGLSWDAWYYDYGGRAHVDVFVRHVGAQTLALVFMYAGRTAALAERDLVITSFETRP